MLYIYIYSNLILLYFTLTLFSTHGFFKINVIRIVCLTMSSHETQSNRESVFSFSAFLLYIYIYINIYIIYINIYIYIYVYIYKYISLCYIYIYIPILSYFILLSPYFQPMAYFKINEIRNVFQL